MRALFIAAALVALAPAAEAKNWNAVRAVDKFTDVKSCRVEPGGPFTRTFFRGLLGGGVALYFFAEKRSEEVRVGVFSEPAIPIGGDLQVRIDDQPLVTITAADTPIDTAPSMPSPNLDALSEQQRTDIENARRTALGAMSPFRAVAGEAALNLLRSILAAKVVRMRVVTVNGPLSRGVEWSPDADLATAIAACGIAL